MSLDYIAAQTFNGLASGAYYALLALGLSIIFGTLRIINFAHGAMYMLGAFGAYYGAQLLGLPFFAALIVVPIAVGILGMLLEWLILRRIARSDPIYGLLLTFALTLVIVNVMTLLAGTLGSPYSMPGALSGATNLGFTIFPTYKLFVISVSLAVCVVAWLVVDRSLLGARIRAAIENPVLVRAFGVNTPRLVTVTFGIGVAIAALAGVLAAPTTNVLPTMGDDIIIYTFAIVVIGGLGSITGSIIAGFLLGLLQAIGAVYYPPIATTLIFIVMVIVIWLRPSGLLGRPESTR
ncbi:MAG TPA: branched-chain amino acid ABC transporter permease [Candidatus Baltobacteraceae bacterium]|nr:branched-chain amino acid ABC transporter permease [Candidatus Baltobacteraceae bacterium]